MGRPSLGNKVALGIIAFVSLGKSAFLVTLVCILVLFLIRDTEKARGYRSMFSLFLGGDSSSKYLETGLFVIIGLLLLTGGIQNDQSEIPQDVPNPSASEYQNAYEKLEENYTRVLEEYESLSDNYNELYDRHQSTEDELDELRDRMQYALTPPYSFVENRTLNVVYKTLEGEIKEHWWKGYFEPAFYRGTMMRRLSYDEMEYLEFSEMTRRFEERSKYIDLEDQGLVYQLEPFMNSKPFEKLAKDIYDRYDSDEKRIRAVWNFVKQGNTYTPELRETPRTPIETLLLKGGDCEDSAILTASILEAMPGDLDTQFVYMDIYNPEEIDQVNHVALYVETASYSTFVETTSNTTMNPYQDDSVEGYYRSIS